MKEEFPKSNFVSGENFEKEVKEGGNLSLEHNPALSSAVYEALGFKSKDFILPLS